MMRFLIRTLITFVLLTGSVVPAMARDGDTLEPIQIEAPMLETYPEDFLNSEDARVIESRISEARNAGVPLAVRIVDMTQDESDIPFQVRKFRQEDFSQPFSAEKQQEITASWMNSESIETSEDANDGFMLLVLVPEDRTQTQAMWWIGPNALPLNGLTQENILATHAVMNSQFAEGNMPNGVFQGISEFSYNIQFGEPMRLERSDLETALHWAVLPLAIGTALAGLSIPVLAMWLDRRKPTGGSSDHHLTPWEAAALYEGRARQGIPAAMLLDHVHGGDISPTADGGLKLAHRASGPAIDVLRPFADEDGLVSQTAMYEIEAISEPVRSEIEDSLANVGAMTPHAKTDRTWMLMAMGFAVFLVLLAAVPTVVSMSAPGVFAIVIALIGIGLGWWWCSYRSYTTAAGRSVLAQWLEKASPEERHQFDSVIHQDLLIDQDAGPDVSNQTQLVRRLRGLGAG